MGEIATIDPRTIYPPKIDPRTIDSRTIDPGQLIPGQLIPGQFIPGKLIPGQLITGLLIPDNWSPDNWSPDNWPPDNWSPDNWSPDNWPPDNWSPDNWSPDNSFTRIYISIFRSRLEIRPGSVRNPINLIRSCPVSFRTLAGAVFKIFKCSNFYVFGCDARLLINILHSVLMSLKWIQLITIFYISIRDHCNTQ